jgi:NAD-dependent dihydropyrimidine dehydrogenase PreA subunit
LNYWDIPLSEEPEHSLYLRRHPEWHESPINNDFRRCWTRWYAEQYIYVSFLRKNGVIVPADNRTCWNDELCDLYRRTLVNNFVVLDYGTQLMVKSMKYPNTSRVAINPPCVEHHDWLVYYKKYCDPGILQRIPCNMIDPKEISVVIQGSVNYKYINHATASVREYLPDAEIILSTWEGTDVSAVDCDLAVLSEDPGGAVYSIDGDIQNHNRQIRSSKNGLFRATRRYALKLRSDLVLTGAEWLNFFDRFPGRATDYRLTQNRILISNKWTRSCDKSDPCLFHPSDWIHFGTREDVLNYWDIPLSEEPEHSLYLRRHPERHESPINNDFRTYWTRWCAEQYIYVSFLRKNGVIVPADNRTCWNDELCDLYRRTLVNNFVVLDYGMQLTVKSMKYPDISACYNPPCVEHNDWLVYYKKYCDPALLPVPC